MSFVQCSTVGIITGVVARPAVEPSRDIESLPLVAERLGDFVRGRMGESTRQALGRVYRDLEGLFESLLAEAFS